MRPTAFRIGWYGIPAALIFCLTGTAAMAHAASAAHRTLVMKVQRALDKQGAEIKVDGIVGPTTDRALLNFQSAHHLALTGKIDPAVEKALGVG